jgi:hypothetical protein
MLKGYYFSGDDVPSVGSYRVHHYQHRLPHVATVLVVRFPECKHCGTMVRFERIEAATAERPPFLRLDGDFIDSSRDIPVRDDSENAKGFACH